VKSNVRRVVFRPRFMVMRSADSKLSGARSPAKLSANGVATVRLSAYQLLMNDSSRILHNKSTRKIVLQENGREGTGTA
jgi:hypothetical protein